MSGRQKIIVIERQSAEEFADALNLNVEQGYKLISSTALRNDDEQLAYKGVLYTAVMELVSDN